MIQSSVSDLSSQWFAEFDRLAYWVARRFVRRFLYRRARDFNGSDLEELAQDAICRGYDRFAKRCQRDVCGESDRKRWVCQCVICGARDAVRCKSRFGSISSQTAVRDDAMNRFSRQRFGFVHGRDDEKQDALEQVSYQCVAYAVQRWELEQLIDLELPTLLRPTALYAALGLSQETSAALQGLTDRTIRYRLRDIRKLLCPQCDIMAVIGAALQSLLDKPRGYRLSAV